MEIHLSNMLILWLGGCHDFSCPYFQGCRFNIEVPIIIFMNKNSNYSICGLNDLVPKIFYRTSPKG